jgi:hypothetical protein
MYKTEAAFSKAFVNEARKHYGLVQRLETGSIGRGVPDLMVVDQNGTTFVELKNNNRCSILDRAWQVSWRAGQQAWSLLYYKATKGFWHTVTILSCKDGFVMIPMTEHYVDNIVKRTDVTTARSLKEIFI